MFRRRQPSRDDVDRAALVRYADGVRAAGDMTDLDLDPNIPLGAGWYYRRKARRNAAGQVETRAITGLPWNQGGPEPSAINVDRALTLVPVYAAVRLLADTIASLALHRYRMDAKGKARTQLPDNPLLVKPSVIGTFPDWIHRAVTSMALTGNAIGLTTARDSTGYPSMVEWFNPNDVIVLDQALQGPGSFLRPQWFWRGRLLPTEDIVHIPWFTIPYKVLGLSPIGAYAATINTGIAAQQYSNDWFNSGGVPPGKFKNTAKTLEETEAKAIRDRLVNSIRSGKPLVYGADWDYEPIATPPDEAQFIATLQLTATQIASIYGIPPEMIGGNTPGGLNYSTPVLRGDDLLRFSLQPWLARMEAVFTQLLPRPQFAAFDTDKLTTPDALTRHQIYKIDTEIGLRTANEMRAVENWEPLTTPLPVQLPGKELAEPGALLPAPPAPITQQQPGSPASPNGGKPAPVRALDEAWETLERSIGEALHPASTERLMTYWAEGEGAAKIGWGAPGDFDRCRMHLGDKVPARELDGLCANLHHRALGVWPGREYGKK